MAKQTRGFCKYCGKEYSRSGIAKHLGACKSRTADLANEKGKTQCVYFQLSITAKYDNDYWLIIEASENTTLKKLDSFIRDIWVECCGHLSAFTIDGISYEAYPEESSLWGIEAKGLHYKLNRVFSVGMLIPYEYDFGSTTDLLIKVLGYREGIRRKESIIILSRNNPLEHICGQCGTEKAKWLNVFAKYGENPFWCDACIRKNAMEEIINDLEEDELEMYDIEDDDFIEKELGWNIYERFLPVCNSPRMGVCGYEGSHIYPDQFIPDTENRPQ